MSRFTKLELPGFDAAQAGARRTSLLDLAIACEQEGSYEAALRYYSRALAESSRLEAAWVGQVLCLIHLGEYAEAVAWADRALAILPGSADLVAAKAVAWGRRGDLQRAMGFSDSALAQPSASSLAWWARGDILAASDRRAAEHCFRKALESHEGRRDMLVLIARTHLSIGDPAEARRVLLRAAGLAPGSALLQYLLGVSCRAAGLDEEARAAFGRALELKSDHREARAALREMSRRSWLARLVERLLPSQARR